MILRVDVGAQGVIALLDGNGALVEIHDMPVFQEGPARRRAVNAPLLAAIIVKSHANRAFVEFVAARPGEGPTGAFAVGRARVASSKAFLPPLGLPCRSLRLPVGSATSA